MARSPDDFSEGCNLAQATMRSLVERLEEGGIAYAIHGGMAVNAHGRRQTTNDVDVLLTAEGLAAFRRRLAVRYEATPFRQGRRFRDRENGIVIDVFLTGHCPGVRTPGAVTYPDPACAAEVIDGIRYVTLSWLIQLKLAARRFRDLGDVGALIQVHRLDDAFMKELAPSVHPAYIECLEEVRREREREAREG